MAKRASISQLCCFGTAVIAALLMGCSSNDARAEQAFSNYQTALNAGNIAAARKSLLDAVRERDDVAPYWEALARLQLQMGNMSDAAYAFTRAHELDRSNVENLSALSELSLYAGDLDSAHEYARELELLAPNDPAVMLVNGYLELRRSELDSADRDADKLLQVLPLDPGAKLLKARVLVARGQRDEAISLLEDQAAAKPEDVASLKALLMLLNRENEWSKLAEAAARLSKLQPGDDTAALTAIEAAFRANDIAAAKTVSLGLLTPGAPPSQVQSVLQLWARFWPGSAAVQQAQELASEAPPQQRLAYATFFNAVGQPRRAAELAGGGPKTPVTLANSSANAIFAQALAVGGQPEAARQLFDAILKKEPDHVYALRGRTELEIRTRSGAAAVQDALRLITIEPNSAEDRLLLSTAFDAAGDPRGADQSLWQAFHDIPGNEQIYEALRARVQARGGDAKQVDVEFDRQRDLQLAREFI
jgi:predicted Zn-dependent protease